jgi:hypothetical protein
MYVQLYHFAQDTSDQSVRQLAKWQGMIHVTSETEQNKLQPILFHHWYKCKLL